MSEEALFPRDAGFPDPAPAERDAVARADEVIRQAVPADGPGAAVLVLGGAEVLLQAGYGLADVESGAPVTPDTAFDLASVSKHFTAVAVLLLAERGLLDLDGPVGKHLPEWARYGNGRPLRLTDLLGHTSGLPDYPSVWRGAEKETGLVNAAYLRRLRRHRPHFPAGSRAEYCNSNYILLAEAVERADGRTLRRFLHEEVFAPLGMSGTYVQDDPANPLPGRARGYKRGAGGRVEPSDIPIRLVGHSHLFSTAADLGRWYGALWGGRLLGPASLERALTRGRLDGGAGHIYGFGWYDDSSGGRRSVGHSGSWYGFHSYVRRYAEADLTVALLSNDEDFDVEGLVNRLADVFLPGLP
jgi:CubicO group peptidase (beta-lactamase class C family)